MKSTLALFTLLVACGDDGSSSHDAPPANVPPTFVAGGDVTIDEDAGPQSVAWAAAISAGEPDQHVTFALTGANLDLFTVPPAIGADGTLTYTPAPDAFGTTTIQVTALDDAGGTSAASTLALTITGVNDPPTYTPGPDTITFDEDSGAHVVQWATNVSTGPVNEGQTPVWQLSYVIADWDIPPTISPTGMLAFTPDHDAHGIFDITLQLTDGVTITDSATIHIAITNIDDPPVAHDDTFQIFENPPVPQLIDAAGNDVDGDGPPVTIGGFTQPPHGTVTLDAGSGKLAYLSPAEYCNSTPGDPLDVFTYTLVGGAVGTVAMTVKCTSVHAAMITGTEVGGNALVLSPAFDPAVLSYTTTIAASAAQVTFTISPVDQNASIQVNGTGSIKNQPSQPVTVDAGTTKPIAITLDRVNRSTRTYTISVTRP